LLRAQRSRGEIGGFLHRDQRHELDQMVLDDVAGRADAVVVSGPAAEADVLGHRDLHVVDVVAVPDRLEKLVGEPEREDVLDGLLSEVVVDPEDRVLGEHRAHHVVELAGALEIVTEGLLDHDAAPRTVVRTRAASALEVPADGGEVVGWDRQVEGVVPGRSAVRLQFGQHLREPVEALVVVEGPGDESQSLRKLLPDLVTERRAAALPGLLPGELRELLGAPATSTEAHQREAGRQQAAVGEIVDRRDELLLGQVSGDPEDHQTRGTRDPGEPTVTRVPERVDPVRAVVLVPGAGHDPDGISSTRLRTVSINPSQAVTNFSTPWRSSRPKTSSRSMPSARRASSVAREASPVPRTVSPSSAP